MQKGLIKLTVILLLIMGTSVAFYAIFENIKDSGVFKISKIEVVGVINSDRNALTNLANSYLNLNLFDDNIDKEVTSNDPWIKKIVIKKVLPNKLKIIVFEEKVLFEYAYRNQGCFVFLGTGKNMKVNCKNDFISTDYDIEINNGEAFSVILEKFPFLKEHKIVLKDYSFEAYIDDEIIRCPYDLELFAANYKMYIDTIKVKYKKIEYADLTVSKRIYVKGVLNAS